MCTQGQLGAHVHLRTIDASAQQRSYPDGDRRWLRAILDGRKPGWHWPPTSLSARQYLNVTACLLTDSRGIAPDTPGAPAWAAVIVLAGNAPTRITEAIHALAVTT